MSEHNGNEAAFAFAHPSGVENGLTKREYFAARALQGLLASPGELPIGALVRLPDLAVSFADELLETLEGRQK